MRLPALAVSAAALAVGAFAVTAPSAGAQQMNNPNAGVVYFGGGLGLTVPIGSLSDGNNAGYHIQAVGGWEAANTPWGFRGDLTWNSMGGKTINVPDVGPTKFPTAHLLAIDANGVYKFRPSDKNSATTPYALAGLGLYHLSYSDNGGSATKFGFDAGAGLEWRLAGFSAYGEARFHNIFTSGKSARYIPITFGLKFGGV